LALLLLRLLLLPSAVAAHPRKVLIVSFAVQLCIHTLKE